MSHQKCTSRREELLIVNNFQRSDNNKSKDQDMLLRKNTVYLANKIIVHYFLLCDIPLVGGASGFLGTVTEIFSSGTAFLGTSGTLKIFMHLILGIPNAYTNNKE